VWSLLEWNKNIQPQTAHQKLLQPNLPHSFLQFITSQRSSNLAEGLRRLLDELMRHERAVVFQALPSPAKGVTSGSSEKFSSTGTPSNHPKPDGRPCRKKLRSKPTSSSVSVLIKLMNF
jgi:hypothetical protein